CFMEREACLGASPVGLISTLLLMDGGADYKRSRRPSIQLFFGWLFNLVVVDHQHLALFNDGRPAETPKLGTKRKFNWTVCLRIEVAPRQSAEMLAHL